MRLPEDLSKQQWLRARVIFDKVQAAPPNQRSRVLERLCNDDGALLEELRSLLEACEAEETFSDSVGDLVGARIHDSVRKSVGPYELDRLLGRGGMGAVYLAHRADGHFRQQVAIKLIDVPIASELFRRQFRMERQILAGLSHPFIARLLDGGVTGGGELYLVMEYVDGNPILDYCKQNRLSLRARLLLFKNICSAVQYAHQNLVIHRDLKPANILVDSEGAPHLLDFGTAKLLSPVDDDNTSDLTSHGLRSFTPQYASPEQVLGKAVSTATDIYSLGVILFQLSADVPPYVLREKNIEEMLRLICETQPPKPSAVAVSAERPDADLDSIALMALRKEPNERYSTVEQFAADIQAYLDGRPVVARRGTLRYRSLKFAKRNKLALSAAAVVLAAIVCGMGGILWQSRVANLQRIRAEANARQMCELSNNFLSEIDQAVKNLPNSTSVRRLMVQRVVEHLDRVPRNNTGDRLTGLYLVKAYVQLGRLQGSIAEQSVGDVSGALLSLDKALAVAHGLKSEYPDDREVKDALALALKTKSLILYGLGRPGEAITTLKPAIDILSEGIKSPAATAAQITDAADAFRFLGVESGDPETPSAGDYFAALTAYRESTNLYARALMVDPGFIRAKCGIAKNHESVGHILIFTDPVVAVDELRTSLALWDALPISAKSDPENNLNAQFTRDLLAKALTRTRDYRSAISTYEETRKSMEEGVARDAADSRAMTFLAGILGDEAETYIDMLNPVLNAKSEENHQENIRQATVLLRRSIALTQKLVALDQSSTMHSAYLAYEIALLSTLEQKTGSPNNDGQMAAAGVAQLRRLASPADASSEILYRAAFVMVSVLPTRLRDSRLAVQYAERLAASSHHQDPNSLLILAQAYQEDGQVENAVRIAHEGLSHLAQHGPRAPAVQCQVLLQHTLTTILN